MQVVILAGGLGTRLREETEFRPKPMVEVGGRPILWHIMKFYAHYGYTDFVLCLGYKGAIIRDYFLNYETHNCDITRTLGAGKLEFHDAHDEFGWRVTLAETGDQTETGGRLKRASRYLSDSRFMMTYGDGVGDVDIPALLERHIACGKLATITAVRPYSRFGELRWQQNIASSFSEKPQVQEGWINGGFMIFEREILNRIAGDETVLESDLLRKLADERELAVYQHVGFWQCMDTAREMDILNRHWQNRTASWCLWDAARRLGLSSADSHKTELVMVNGSRG
jgi:glucose-1-phosphate cytidylyltransferase